MADRQKNNDNAPITIKKYANRRLYNTATSSYVTLDHLCQMVKDGVEFAVFDAKTGNEITRSVLTQIIVEEENKGQNLLPINFLRQLISFYGDNLQWVVPRYLEHMMGAFSTNQDSMRQNMKESFGTIFPFGNFEEMSKQNIAILENTMRMFSPFGEQDGPHAKAPEADKQNAKAGPARASETEDTLANLKQQVDRLQKQLEVLSRDGEKG